MDYMILNKLDLIYGAILLAEMDRAKVLDHEQYKETLIKQFELMQKVYTKDEKND